MIVFLLSLLRGILFAGYLKGASFPKPLPPAEEKEMVARHLAGDEEARDTLILHNLRLCAHIAGKYVSRGLGQGKRDLDDLISIGTIGLIKAVDTFSPEKGALSGYASRCIENEIRMSLRAQKKLVGEVSMEESLGRDKEGNEMSVLDIMGTDGEEIFQQVQQNLEGEQLRSIMSRCLRPREKLVLDLRYGLSGQAPLTQQQVANQLGISRSYISRIEKRAILKLRLALPAEEE